MMTRKIQMADVVRAHMEVRGCPVLTSNQCYAIAMNLNCQIGAPTPSQPIYDEAKERKLFEVWSANHYYLGGCEVTMEDGEYKDPDMQYSWESWIACAQSRAKAGEVGDDEVLRYLIQKTPIGAMMKPNPEGNWVTSEYFDRVTADADRLRAELECSSGDFAQLERISDALQQRLTAADERVGVLEGLVGEVLDAVGREPLDLDAVLRLRARMRAALKPAEGHPCPVSLDGCDGSCAP